MERRTEKFVIEIRNKNIDGEFIELDEVFDAVDRGLDSFGMTLVDVTHYDSYEED